MAYGLPPLNWLRAFEASARHLSFADPDFLNGPTHALKVARALHARHPSISFDFTAKIDRKSVV